MSWHISTQHLQIVHDVSLTGVDPPRGCMKHLHLTGVHIKHWIIRTEGDRFREPAVYRGPDIPSHIRNCPATGVSSSGGLRVVHYWLHCSAPPSRSDGCLRHTSCSGPTWCSSTAKLHLWLRPDQGRTASTHPSCLQISPDILLANITLAPVLSHQAEALSARACR